MASKKITIMHSKKTSEREIEIITKNLKKNCGII